MADEIVEPSSTCGACDKTDTEPKHQILVGFNNPATNGQMFHEHDKDRDGVIHYHFDCPTPWHGAVNAEYHARLAELCKSGVRGDELRARILAGEV